MSSAPPPPHVDDEPDDEPYPRYIDGTHHYDVDAGGVVLPREWYARRQQATKREA